MYYNQPLQRQGRKRGLVEEGVGLDRAAYKLIPLEESFMLRGRGGLRRLWLPVPRALGRVPGGGWGWGVGSQVRRRCELYIKLSLANSLLLSHLAGLHGIQTNFVRRSIDVTIRVDVQLLQFLLAEFIDEAGTDAVSQDVDHSTEPVAAGKEGCLQEGRWWWLQGDEEEKEEEVKNAKKYY